MKFTVHATDGAARAATLKLAHGEVETPVFMPIGTYGAVKAVSPAELLENGTRIILGNTFHLWLRPGPGVIAAHAGGVDAHPAGAERGHRHGARRVHALPRERARDRRIDAPKLALGPTLQALVGRLQARV